MRILFNLCLEIEKGEKELVSSRTTGEIVGGVFQEMIVQDIHRADNSTQKSFNCLMEYKLPKD